MVTIVRRQLPPSLRSHSESRRSYVLPAIVDITVHSIRRMYPVLKGLNFCQSLTSVVGRHVDIPLMWNQKTRDVVSHKSRGCAVSFEHGR